MAFKQIRHLVSKPGRNGRPRFYWQPSDELRKAGWTSARLPNDAGDAEREAERRNQDVDAWRKGNPPLIGAAPPAPKSKATPGTVDAMIERYKDSRFYRDLAPATRRSYDWHLRLISDWCGDKPARAISPGMAQEFYEDMYEATLAKANGTMRVGRTLWQRGSLFDLVDPERNPFAKAGLNGSDQSGLPWPSEAIAAFVRAADAIGRWSMGTAVVVDEWLGQRQADILSLPLPVTRAEGVIIRQGKTGAGVDLPIGMVPHLTARIAEERARQVARQVVATTLIVDETTGRPYNVDTFRHVFAEIRQLVITGSNELGLPPVVQFEVDYVVPGRDPKAADARIIKMADLKFMYLRHTAVVRLAEAGCDLPLISAITGHTLASIKKILERYLIRTGKMARAAFARRLRHEREQKA